MYSTSRFVFNVADLDFTIDDEEDEEEHLPEERIERIFSPEDVLLSVYIIRMLLSTKIPLMGIAH